MAAAKDITVIIDGIKVQVPDGTYVWDACRKIGIEIPNFCYLPGLRAFGACRMCVVEVTGRKGWELVTSCSTPATEGMEVRTVNDRIWQQRNMVMEALDTDHPVDCPICEANGDCRLQDYGYEYGVVGTDTRRPKIVRPAERLSPAIDLDRDRCVVCGRCVRECDEVVGALALAFVERGVESLIDAPFGKSLLETPCTSCGMCMEVCPVGALSSRINLKMEHHWWQRKTETTCTYCSVGCTIKLGSVRNQVYEVRSDDQLGLNDGVTCVKGRSAMDFVNSNNRLSKPLVRRDGRLVPATWDEALDLVASKLEEHRGATAVVASPKLTNEENYVLQKVTRLGLGTNNIDWDGRATESVALEVLRERLGYPAQTNNLIDTRQKAGCVIAIGDSIYETHPVYGYQLQRMVRLMNKKVVVISPRWAKMQVGRCVARAPAQETWCWHRQGDSRREPAGRGIPGQPHGEQHGIHPVARGGRLLAGRGEQAHGRAGARYRGGRIPVRDRRHERGPGETATGHPPEQPARDPQRPRRPDATGDHRGRHPGL